MQLDKIIANVFLRTDRWMDKVNVISKKKTKISIEHFHLKVLNTSTATEFLIIARNRTDSNGRHKAIVKIKALQKAEIFVVSCFAKNKTRPVSIVLNGSKISR